MEAAAIPARGKKRTVCTAVWDAPEKNLWATMIMDTIRKHVGDVHAAPTAAWIIPACRAGIYGGSLSL
jgi:hypothetical protein